MITTLFGVPLEELRPGMPADLMAELDAFIEANVVSPGFGLATLAPGLVDRLLTAWNEAGRPGKEKALWAIDDGDRPMSPSKRVQAWPRCRWCHKEIRPEKRESPELADINAVVWVHVGTDEQRCATRPNLAEPVPQIHEEPFMLAAWEFVARYRKLRRVFREVSQSRASAIRRMRDYQELADKLIDALQILGTCKPTDPAYPLYLAVKAIRDYRLSQISAGWR